MTATLAAWLAEQGAPRRGRLSALEIHPQDRPLPLFARMRELFGDRLDDADERFWP